ncbi:MAG: SUMF1/EgtB/PvdO family nonheme iron enzyme, partial [Candidatus Competibacteraceae bacterium]|nr:SUMF1/EgtB/PvdO family nonheme iron enzyme [Candidatus Competibacteraceae bacterium]
YGKPYIITIDDSDATRVLRGGSWVSNQINSRAAYRDFNRPGIRGNEVGFRLCRSFYIEP